MSFPQTVENPVGNYILVVQREGPINQGFPKLLHMTGVTALWVLAIKSGSAPTLNPQTCHETVIGISWR